MTRPTSHTPPTRPPGGHSPHALLAAVLLACAAAGGCAAPAASSPTASAAPATVKPPVTVARALGTQQCGDQPHAATAELLLKALRGAGVDAQALRCGHDGRMRPQVCGAPDGRLAVVDVPAAQVDAAKAQGFEPLLARWPDARSEPCR